MNNYNILVTGGAGFIGSHLCEKLSRENYGTLCLDNFNENYNPEIKRDNISNILKYKNSLLIEADILDTIALKNIFQKYPIKKVIHLAAIAGVRPSLVDPIIYIDTDIKGTVNLLEMSRRYGVEQFIYGSSSSVYGINSKIPFSESDRVDLQVSPYATAKRGSELYCATYSHLYGIKTSILRFFTVYGPRQRPDMAFHKFTRLLFKGEKIPLFGYGKLKRDYTYVTDIVNGIILAMEKEYDFEVFNLGSGKTISLNELLEILSKILVIEPKIELLPEQPGDVPITWADISKAQKMLGYAPRTSIEKGLKEFVRWYREKESLIENEEEI